MGLKIIQGDALVVPCLGLPAGRRAVFGMGGFAYYTDIHNTHEVALVTGGAGPCQIILVHTQYKTGALGHYPGTNHPGNIVAGLEQMLQSLEIMDDAEVAAVYFAAGQQMDGADDAYQAGILPTARARFAKADVQWLKPEGDDVYGDCIYFPTKEEASFFVDSHGVTASSNPAGLVERLKIETQYNQPH